MARWRYIQIHTDLIGNTYLIRNTASYRFDWEFLELIDELALTQAMDHPAHRCNNLLGLIYTTDVQFLFEVSNEMFSDHNS